MFLLDFLYPSFCLECRCRLQNKAKTLCKSCLSMMEPIDPQARCSLCFGPHPPICLKCRKNSFYPRVIATFDAFGPAKTLYHELEAGEEIASGMAAFMARQFLQCDPFKPDLLVPIPQHPWKRRENPNYLLAHALSPILAVPIATMLVQEKQLKSLDPNTHKVITQKKITCKKEIPNQKILLIQDNMESGDTLKLAARSLLQAGAKEVWALVFCRRLDG